MSSGAARGRGCADAARGGRIGGGSLVNVESNRLRGGIGVVANVASAIVSGNLRRNLKSISKKDFAILERILINFPEF